MPQPQPVSESEMPDDVTEEVEEPVTDRVPVTGIHPDDPDDEWVAAPARGVRIRAFTGVLMLVVVLAGGFWGGVLAEKHHGTAGSSSTSALASRFAAAARSAGLGGTGTGTGTGEAGGATTGTVIGVTGDILYVSNSSGSIVKVTVGPATTVTRTSKSSLAGLKTGDTVIVTGSPGAGGTVNATAIRATQQGVTTGTGFAGGLGFNG